MKPVFSYQCAIAALMLVFGAFSCAIAQTPSATPDPLIAQLTSSPAGGATNPFLSAAGDITANGRFVVIESNGDIATEKTATRNNADGNREIFLFDYAQRRFFQITDTKNVLKAPASPTPTPSPAASPTPTPAPTPADPAQIQVEISNNRPMISFEPVLVGGPVGTRVFTIVFSSNAPHPALYDGTGPLANDATNQEIWIYQLPPVTDVANLASGDELFQDLTGGTFARITDTPASRAPSAGTGLLKPFVADDNREATISDNGDIIAFISTRTLPGTANADGNPELFLASRVAADWSTFTLAQGTNTQDETVGAKIFSRFQQNPSLSATGGRVAFLSSANLAGTNNDDGSGHGNAEVYVADFSGSGLTNIRQVTRTKTDATAATVNLLSPGRRLSRDGAFIALESLAEDPKANSTTNKTSFAIFVYNVSGDTFALAALRATEAGDFGFIHFPAFTDYDGSLAPHTLVFASALNFKVDGTFPAADQAATGLNPENQPQIFSTQIPVTSTNTYARLTKNPVAGFGGMRPLTSNTRERIAFSVGGSELGGGNADLSTEVFYLITRVVSADSAAGLSFFTGASNLAVAEATPTPSPAPSPTPSPTPGTVALGLAPGELSIVRSTVALGPSDKAAVGGSETARSPILPVELNGVSVSVNGAAAGLYSVGDSPAEGIKFVMPIGLTTGVKTVVVNNNGTVHRGFVQIVAAQPDIFTSTNDAGGTAVVCNVTHDPPSGCQMGPFRVTSPDSTGAIVPTVLEIWLTGVRGVAATEARVTVGTTDITPTLVRPNTNMFGFDLIKITLPASLAGAAPVDYTVVVTVTKSGGTFQSRAVATAPTITIIP